MGDFKKLLVWRKAHALALNVHRAARRIRGTEYVSLRSQLLRTAMSVSANIVEGSGQKSALEFGRFVRFALNSSRELQSHLIFARDIGAIEKTTFDGLAGQTVEVRKMLHGLLRSLQTPATKPPPAGPGVVN